MKYLKKDFIADVISEATLLRDNATDAEKSRLNFENLDPEDFSACIYGQMAFDCRSKRAATLIEKCCQRFIKSYSEGEFKERGFASVKKQVNGKTVEDFVDERTNGPIMLHFSSIEAYILAPNAKNKNLIAFIKGEINKPVL